MQFVGIIGTKPFISKSCSPAFCSHNSNSNEIDFGRLDAGLLRQWDLMKEFIWFRTTMSSAGFVFLELDLILVEILKRWDDGLMVIDIESRTLSFTTLLSWSKVQEKLWEKKMIQFEYNSSEK